MKELRKDRKIIQILKVIINSKLSQSFAIWLLQLYSLRINNEDKDLISENLSSLLLIDYQNNGKSSVTKMNIVRIFLESSIVHLLPSLQFSANLTHNRANQAWFPTSLARLDFLYNWLCIQVASLVAERLKILGN